MIKRVLLLIAMLHPATLLAAEVFYQQTIELNPGWNAVYLEVEPEDDAIDRVFAGIPVDSVWRWIPKKIDQVEFIQDPAAGLLNVNGWYGYFPYPKPEAFLTNLFSLRANQSYLVNLAGSKSVSWTITGKPKVRRTQWGSNSFNLVGMPVEPGAEPTFGDYFSLSPAHANQPIYKLNHEGIWELIEHPYAMPIKSGEAYWVYTEGPSTYQGPMEISLENSSELEYTASLTTQRVIVENHTDIPTAITVTRKSAAAEQLPMNYELVEEADNERSWPSLQQAVSYLIDAENDVIFNLSVARAQFSEERMEEILEFTNGLGSRILVHVGGNTTQPPLLPASIVQASTAGATRSAIRAPEALHPLAGLWVGVVQITGVNEAQLGDVTPQPTDRSFPMRFIFHVDTAGQARLIKDVIEMWEDGTYKPSASDPTMLETDIPGRYVLLTDDSLIPNFSGATTRDGTPVGIRHSTVAYDFEEQYQVFEPTLFAPPFTMSTTIRIGSEFPTNPFKHKYHPDHDNLDAQFLNYRGEAFEVTRAVTFEFTPDDPSGNNPPEWGDSILGGYYRETISGLHRNAIFVEGDFRFRRISSVPLLNQ